MNRVFKVGLLVLGGSFYHSCSVENNLAPKPNSPVISLTQKESKNIHVTTGPQINQNFTHPTLNKSYQDRILHFYIPPFYQSSKPIGLFIFLHGGGATTSSEDAKLAVVSPRENKRSYRLLNLANVANVIIASPTAPWDNTTPLRWNQAQVDDYISAVILESQFRFNIDKLRIFLGGHSMGGFGAMGLSQKFADRLAGGVIISASWKVINFKAFRGLPLFIIHGKHDAWPQGKKGKRGRPRFTDVFYARSAHKLLLKENLPHIYYEFDGGHKIRKEALPALEQLSVWMKRQKKADVSKKLTLISHRGWDSQIKSAYHREWLSIHNIGKETLSYDKVYQKGPPAKWGESAEAFFKQSFLIKKVQLVAGMIEAEYLGNNKFNIKTTNVNSFSIWLHEDLIDFAKPVRVNLNGKNEIYKSTGIKGRHKDLRPPFKGEILLSVDD